MFVVIYVLCMFFWHILCSSMFAFVFLCLCVYGDVVFGVGVNCLHDRLVNICKGV